MPTPVPMPKQGNSVEECLIVEWAVSEGAAVKEGDTLCTIETDKATFEVPSPATGTLIKTFFPAGELVPVLINIAVIGEPGEDADAFAPGDGGAEAEAAAEPAPATAPVATSASAATTAAPGAMPQAGPAASVQPGMGVSPRARNLARRLGVDAAQVSGSGPGGRVVSLDIQNAVDAGLAMTRAASAAASQGLVAGTATGIGGRARIQDLQAPIPGSDPARAILTQPPTEVPFKGIRKLIGERMMQSLTSHAQLTLNSSADASAILALRGQIKKNAEAMGLPNITLNDMISLVVVKTLLRFPELNGIFAPGSGKLLQYHQVHLGMAVDTERGLMVPVVQDAHAMTLPQLSLAIADLAQQCRGGSLNPDLLQGGTFTITNLGTMGIESFTPVLNTPQVAILGVCAIKQVPIPGPDGGLTWQPRMGLSLTIDHQVVDGAPASRFLQAVADGIGNFALMLV